MMIDVLGIKPVTKDEGLTAFADRGYLLVDATYSPVNYRHLSPQERDALILKDLPLLEADLREHGRLDTRLVLVKANVCDLLESRLTSRGLSALNRGKRLPFPSTGQQGKFRTMIREVLEGKRRTR
jgi:hypothetical protein